MKLVGFNFTKISIERISEKIGQIQINTNIDISEFKEFKADLFRSREKLLQVSFNYIINYNPEVAKLELNGRMILEAESKIAKEALKQWQDKKLPEEFRLNLFNLILRKSNVKALELEEEMGLPLHIAMPFLKKEAKEPSSSDS